VWCAHICMHLEFHPYHSFHTISPLIDRAAALGPMLLWPRHSSSDCSAHCNIEGRRGGCECRHRLRSADRLLITIVCNVTIHSLHWQVGTHACACTFLTSCHVHTVPLLHSTPARLSRSFDPFQEGPNPLKIIKVLHSCWLREPCTTETSLTSASLTD